MPHIGQNKELGCEEISLFQQAGGKITLAIYYICSMGTFFFLPLVE